MSTMRAAMGLGPSPAPTTGSDTLSWSERWDGALCTQSDADLWYSDYTADRRKAVAICKQCPLVLECAEYGRNEQHGIWAGIDRNSGRPQPFEAQRTRGAA